MAQIDLNPVQAVTIFAGAVFAPQVADFVGPYVVILLGAMGGAAIALMNAEAKGRGRAALIFMSSVFISVLLTVSVATGIAAYFSWRDTWLFAPVALALGYLGDKLPQLFRWAGTKLDAMADAFIRRRDEK